MSQRKLIALDEDDLAVVSAHVQDAAVAAGDIIWRQGEKRLVIGMRRPDWDETIARACEPHRLISALRFDRVLACKSRGIDMAAPDAALTLLGIEFHPASPPSGNVLLLFSGGVLRLDVECLECELADLGPDDLAAASDDGAPSDLASKTDI
jgi:hypothetical protein